MRARGALTTREVGRGRVAGHFWLAKIIMFAMLLTLSMFLKPKHAPQFQGGANGHISEAKAYMGRN